MAAGGSSHGFFCGMTQAEHKALVESTRDFRGSVVRIIRKRKGETFGTGTAFLVYKGDRKSLFLTCDHNFGKLKNGEHIRLYDGQRDYPVAEIIWRTGVDHDLLLFSVKFVPEGNCLEFSTDEVKKDDRVVILGYVNPDLRINKELKQLVLVKEPAPLTGIVVTEPFEDKAINHEKIFVTCEAEKGSSGSPLLKNKKVIGVHLAVDGVWREAVSAKTLLQKLREWIFENGSDNEETFEKLFEMAYNKSEGRPVVPNAELSTSQGEDVRTRKASKRGRRRQ